MFLVRDRVHYVEGRGTASWADLTADLDKALAPHLQGGHQADRYLAPVDQTLFRASSVSNAPRS